MTYADAEMRGATLYAKLIAALLHGEAASCAELARVSGLHLRTVQRYVNALAETRPQRCVYVAEWLEDARGNRSVRGFKLGSKRNATRPKLSRAEKSERDADRRRRRKVNTLFKEIPT